MQNESPAGCTPCPAAQIFLVAYVFTGHTATCAEGGLVYTMDSGMPLGLVGWGIWTDVILSHCFARTPPSLWRILATEFE